MPKKPDPTTHAIDALLRDGDAKALVQALLAELRANVDLLRCDVMDAVILSGLLLEAADVQARGEMPLPRVGRVRVIARLLAASVVKVEEKARALADASGGPLQ